MIKSDELSEFVPTTRYERGEGITLKKVQDVINEHSAKVGIPVAFANDQVKSGGLFNSSVEDCIVMYHPKHMKDYVRFCIRVKHQGTYAFLSIDEFGKSKQGMKDDLDDFAKSARQGQSLNYKLSSKIVYGIATIGRNKQKLEEEMNYYDCISDIFNDIIEEVATL